MATQWTPGPKVENRGAAFEFGDAHLIVPELTVDQAEELAEKIDEVQEPIEELADADRKDSARYRAYKAALRKRSLVAKEVISAALRNNYPDIPDGVVSKFVTVGNWATLFNAVMGYSGRQQVRETGEITQDAMSYSGRQKTGGAGEINPAAD